MFWVRLDEVEPRLEQVYLIYSPQRGYEVAVWENKPLHRMGHWDGVTHWAQFPLIGPPPSESKSNG